MKKSCVFCNCEKEVNILVLGKNICSECANELQLTPIQSEKYSLFMKGVKKILQFG